MTLNARIARDIALALSPRAVYLQVSGKTVRIVVHGKDDQPSVEYTTTVPRLEREADRSGLLLHIREDLIERGYTLGVVELTSL